MKGSIDDEEDDICFCIAQPLFAQQQESNKFVKVFFRLVKAINKQDYE